MYIASVYSKNIAFKHEQSLWETAVEKSWLHTDYLAALSEYELSDRYQRRTQKWVKEAKLSASKTFTKLEQDRFSSLNQAALAKRDLGSMTAMTRLDKYRVIIIDDIG